jgi:hypothetical protein
MKLSKNNQIIIAITIIIVVAIGLKVFLSKPAQVYNADNSLLGTEDRASANLNTTVPNSETGNGKIKSLDVPAPATAYASKDDGFAVNFPTVPKVSNTTYKSDSAGLIPLTEYTQEYASGLERAWYKVAVYHFPANYKFTDSFLDDSADVYIGSVNAMHPGSKVANHQKTEFLGNPAITGIITVPVRLGLRSAATTDTNDYAMITLKGQDLYIISAYGMTQDNFDSFLNSFKFQ